MKIKQLIALFTLLPLISNAGVEDLLISEIVVTPTVGEFIEIYNNGADPINLSNVYLTDATFAGGSVYYWQIANGGGAGGGGGFNDFHARFPNNATILPGAYQTISITGSTNFFGEYGFNPTYELYEDAGSADAVDDMRMAFTDSIATPANTAVDNCAFGNPCPSQLSGGEVAILYSWDGTSDLVQDLDYAVWGDKNEAVTKTNVMINASSYEDDTLIASQSVISTSQHVGGKSWQRGDFMEGTETQAGGNGITGSDETSENLNNTFYEADPTPNTAGTPPPPNVIINEVDAVGTIEFIELFGSAGASLNDVTLVFYQSIDDTIYQTIDLSGEVMDNNGYFLVGDTSLTPDVILPASSLSDTDAGAVAIYYKNISNFNNGDLINDVDFANDIIDAMVYHSGTPDDGGLLALLNASEPQVDEDSNAAKATESNARCANGSGGTQNTSTYMQVPPTAGTINNMCPVTPYYATVDPTNATTLRNTLHDVIKVAVSFPYSNGSPNTWEILSFADEDHNTVIDTDTMVAEAVWMVYKNNSFTYNGGGQQAYNREHTWPQSKGFHQNDMGTDNTARTDAHHLMMSDKDYNNIRNNKYFDNCNPSNDGTCTNNVTAGDDTHIQTTEYDGDGDAIDNPVGGNTGSTYPGNSNWTNNSVFEVWNFRKGDIARAMFYMDVRYEGSQIDSASSPQQMEPDLILTDDIGQLNAGGPYMGLLSILLEWHEADPVDQIEKDRNEVVFSYQTNRNPFVDHPEWAACIFQDICPADDTIFSNGFED